MTTPQVRKVCVACKADVSQTKRVRDDQGRYYCHPCWNKRQKSSSPPQNPRGSRGKAGRALGDKDLVAFPEFEDKPVAEPRKKADPAIGNYELAAQLEIDVKSPVAATVRTAPSSAMAPCGICGALCAPNLLRRERGLMVCDDCYQKRQISLARGQSGGARGVVWMLVVLALLGLGSIVLYQNRQTLLGPSIPKSSANASNSSGDTSGDNPTLLAALKQPDSTFLIPRSTAIPASAKPIALQNRDDRPILLVFDRDDESDAAISACKKSGFKYERINGFQPDYNYGAVQAIICGSNSMVYWNREGNGHFQNIEKFIEDGGHFVAFGAWNGEGINILQKYGIGAGYMHALDFDPVPEVTDTFAQGFEDLLPKSRQMRCTSNLQCTADCTVIFARRNNVGGPAMLTLKSGQGRVTVCSCEPYWSEQTPASMWLIPMTISWMARDCPVGSASKAVVARMDKSEMHPLVAPTTAVGTPNNPNASSVDQIVRLLIEYATVAQQADEQLVVTEGHLSRAKSLRAQGDINGASEALQQVKSENNKYKTFAGKADQLGQRIMTFAKTDIGAAVNRVFDAPDVKPEYKVQLRKVLALGNVVAGTSGPAANVSPSSPSPSQANSAVQGGVAAPPPTSVGEQLKAAHSWRDEVVAQATAELEKIPTDEQLYEDLRISQTSPDEMKKQRETAREHRGSLQELLKTLKNADDAAILAAYQEAIRQEAARRADAAARAEAAEREAARLRELDRTTVVVQVPCPACLDHPGLKMSRAEWQQFLSAWGGQMAGSGRSGQLNMKNVCEKCGGTETVTVRRPRTSDDPN